MCASLAGFKSPPFVIANTKPSISPETAFLPTDGDFFVVVWLFAKPRNTAAYKTVPSMRALMSVGGAAFAMITFAISATTAAATT